MRDVPLDAVMQAGTTCLDTVLTRAVGESTGAFVLVVGRLQVGVRPR